ncbi:MAG: hypothetical protein U9N83_15635 [Thermodesulfobacteriota bacterium]|nr:hypothetical protein [Thermodesulfobacteriota bacterium]
MREHTTLKITAIIKTLFMLVGMVVMDVHLGGAQAVNSNIRIIRQQALEIKLDLSTQVLGLDILDDREDKDWSKIEGPLPFQKVEADLFPTIKSIRRDGTEFVSASILVAKAKQFDDGLFAVLEYLCQKGTESFVSKRELLQRVAESLKGLAKEKEINEKSLNYCRGFIVAAADLGGQQLAETKEVQIQAEQIKSDFLSNQLQSEPIGFYTWTKDLSKIFQQDRLLQKNIEADEKIRLLAKGLSKDNKTLTAYKTYLSFVETLTNPFPPEYCDLSKFQDIQKKKKYSFFPPSQAHETELIKRLYGNRPILDDFSLIDAFIQKIQEGKINLAPKEDSGWYDYQVYALEPFVNHGSMPEAKKLYFGNRYKQELIDLFKASISLTRETHIKQLEVPEIEMSEPLPSIKIYPELSIEPIATYYLRRAKSYGFIRKLLESTFGNSALKNAHRLTASGEVSKSLFKELLNMESLFYGAYQIVSQEIGMDIQPQERGEQAKEADEKYAREWIRTFTDDTDVRTDNRMMVPVFYDRLRKKTKVWVVLGYSVKPLSIWFSQKPKVTVTDVEGKRAKADIEFESTRKSLIYPVSAEIYVNKILNRSEFRSLCDRYKNQSAILNALRNL